MVQGKYSIIIRKKNEKKIVPSYLLKLQRLSAIFLSQPHLRLYWTGYSDVPWFFGFIISSSPGTHGLVHCSATVANIEDRNPPLYVAVPTARATSSTTVVIVIIAKAKTRIPQNAKVNTRRGITGWCFFVTTIVVNFVISSCFWYDAIVPFLAIKY